MVEWWNGGMVEWKVENRMISTTPSGDSTIQPFNHSTIQPFNHSTIPPFHHYGTTGAFFAFFT
jgi:hypothetical protein